MHEHGGVFFCLIPFNRRHHVPRKSGHTCNADLTIIHHGGWCPDLSGPGSALLIGYETKKDTSMLIVQFLSCITLKRSVRVMC